MKHRLLLCAAILVFLVSLGFGSFSTQGSASAAPDYYYTNGTFNGIQGPNPFASGDQPQTITYDKAADTSQWWGFAHGIYIDTSQPITTNNSAVCYPAIQTASKKYDGDTKAILYEECGDNGKSHPEGPKTITISTTRPASSAAQTFCKDKSGSEQSACVAGYDGQTNGQTEQDACSGFNGTDLSTCQAAWTQSQSDANNNQDNTCESSGGGFSLNWALCDAYQGTQSVTNYVLNNIISPLLSSTPICLPNNPNCHDTIYQIWSHFRVYGDIFLVITLLVIVFGESIGGGMIEAYTAKKVLPRLLAAAILLNLSIYIMAFAIDMTNIIGGGIGQLITGPLPGNGSLFTIKPGSITAGAIFGTAAGAGLLAGAFAINVTGVALLLLGLAITGALAILAVFVTLIIRQSIIIGLVLISPIAFALWCLPNTERWFKRWWDTFFQMLLVYPMVIVLFAVADVMSYLTANNGNGGSYVNNIIAFLLLLIPLYLVPFTLRSSNRLMGAIQGATSGVARQINAVSGRRVLGAAGQEVGKTWALTRSGDRFRGAPEGSLQHRLNRGLARVSNLDSFGRSGLRPSNIRDDLNAAVVAQKNTARRKLAEESSAFQTFAGNDDMLEASGLLYHDGEQAARNRLAQGHITGRAQDTAIAQIRAAQRQMGGQNLALTAAVANAATGTGYSQGPGVMYDSIARAAGGDMLVAGSAYAEARGGLEKARRFDSLESFSSAMDHMAAISSATNPSQRALQVQRANEEGTAIALEVQGMGAVLGGRGQSVRNFGPAIQQRLQDAQMSYHDAQDNGSTTIRRYDPETDSMGNVTLTADEAQRNWIQTMASTSAAIDSAGGAAPEVQRMLADTVHNGSLDLTQFPQAMRDTLSRGTTPGTTSIPLSTAMSNLEDQDAFAQMKKVYTRSFEAAAGGAGAGPAGQGGGPIVPPVGPGPVIT